MRTFLKWIVVSFVLCMVMTSCDPNREVQIKAIRETIESRLHDIEGLRSAAAQLQKIAEQTGDANIINAAKVAKETLDKAEEVIPQLQAKLTELESAGPSVPIWKAALALAYPIVVPLLKLIPGVGGPVATIIAEIGYKLAASKSARQRDEEAHALLDKTKPNT